MAIICPQCKHAYKDHKNPYGRVCSKCGFFIEPDENYPITKYTKKNRITSRFLREQVIRAVKKRLNSGE